MTIHLPLGPLIVGIDGVTLDNETSDLLRHPSVGGVILFARNFESPGQLQALSAAIGRLREPRLLVTVDQEGGRVQRFREDFTPLPPLAVLGRWYQRHPDRARDLAYRHGRVMAAEVLDVGVDLSFAPVLDLDRGSEVIGDRAMSEDPDTVADLAAYYIAGMRDAGMRCCAKHYPGHGSVRADSHHEVVVDERADAELDADLEPFARLVKELDSVMMAHVCYTAVDEQPAGFSGYWIGGRLRGTLGFEGVVISDDLDMIGASTAGGLEARLDRALQAGCDAALVCKPSSVRELLDRPLDLPAPPAGRLEKLYGRAMMTMDEQLLVPEFRTWRESLRTLTEESWKK